MENFYSMDIAPKDGTRILVWNVNDYDTTGQWMLVAWLLDYVHYPGSRGTMRWCVPESFQDEQGGYITADNPICWTHLPKDL